MSSSEDNYYLYLRGLLEEDLSCGRISDEDFYFELNALNRDFRSVHRDNVKDDQEDALDEYR